MIKGMLEHIQIPYTIAFCIADNKVLMVKRAKPPNQGLWNGIGGKIEEGETPLQAVSREIMEEAELDINTASAVHYAGIVTWAVVEDQNNKNKGMYAYVIDFSADTLSDVAVETPEGLLEWKKLSWVEDKTNQEIVRNIAHFLPLMRKKDSLQHYHCEYQDGKFHHLSIDQM